MNLKRTFLSLLCVALSLLMLASCGVTIHENLGEGDAINKSSGVVWYHASTCYEAVELEKKAGKLVVTSKESLELYKIPDMDPEKWLATEDKNILYAKGTSLPTLSDMAPIALHFYVDSASERRLHTIDNGTALSAIITDYMENEPAPYPASTPHQTYRVRFESNVYPGLYYVLTYIEYSSDYIVEDTNYGKYFLYNRFDQKFVPVGDDIHTILGLE